ncbi:thioredoxin-like protein [Agrocybe pediades]|nr:thioredoxin-like protein [Agrocybe pediades]
MITVHHLNNSRSQRVLWLLEELEVPYEIKKYKRAPEGRAPPELLAIHPLGKSPIITDGETTVAESGAIVEYLIQKYGSEKSTVPSSGQLDNLYYNHYAEGSLQPVLTRCEIFSKIPPAMPFFLRPILRFVFNQVHKVLDGPELMNHSKMIEAHLENRTWFAGGDHPTSADYLMGFTLEHFLSVVPEYAGPRIVEYVKRIQDRPAYKHALERGGEYAFLLKN